MKKIERMKELIKILNKAKFEYYQNNNEIISNYEYDKLFDELKSLEIETEVILNNSPTQKVGYTVMSKLSKIEHINPLLSLDKTKSVRDLYKFMSSYKCLLMYKLDGLTIEITYENGIITQAQTRGDGEIGELITHNIKTFKNIPKKINYKGRLRVVGEGVIDYMTFEQVCKDEDFSFANPRVLASGTARQLDSKVCANRNIEFYAFGVNEGFEDIESKHQTFLELKKLGFEICKYYCVIPTDENLQEILNFVSDSEKILPIDGMVMTYDSKTYSKLLGATSHHPKHSIAFKWKDEHAKTILRDIKIDIGKSGQVSYVGIFDPVELDGTTVEKATLHNYDRIENLELGINDEIHVIKANMIIPQITNNLTKSGTYKKAEKCPICNSKLVHKGVHQFCDNYNCERQIVGRLVHWCSRKAMNIEGMSEETIKAIRKIKKENGVSVLNTVANIYSLPLNKDVLIELDGFGKRKVEKICKAIEKSKTMPLNNVIYGLSIPQVGKKASKILAEHYKDIREFLKYYKNSMGLHHSQIKTLIGESVGDSFMNNFYNDKIISIIELLDYYGLSMIQPHEEKSNKLEGKVFVVTGSVHIHQNRKEIQNKIESLGGKVSGNVSKNTSFLVNNDFNSNSSKNTKAKELNVPIITEEDFIKIINQ